MDFHLPDDIEKLRIKTKQFVDSHIIPLESDKSSYDDHENINLSLLTEIKKRVKKEGLWSPQMPTSRGGLGYGPIGMSVLYEEMNRSIFGPVCFNCAAPDDGNMYILNKIGTDDQKSKLTVSGLRMHERLVEFPFWDEYAELLKSDIADQKNIGGALGGSITAGKFLEVFTDYPWMHFDIAGPAFLSSDDHYRLKGGTGSGVRILFDYLSKMSQSEF